MPQNYKPAAAETFSQTTKLGKKGKLKADYYQERLRSLQIELLKLQRWIFESKERLIAIIDGVELTGKSGVIRALTERLDSALIRFSPPKADSGGKWYFANFVSKLPRKGEIAVFDRGWYGKAALERATNACSDEEYERYTHQIPLFEQALSEDGFKIFKYMLSASKEELIARLESQKNDPLGRLRLTETELKSAKLYDEYAKAQAETLSRTHTPCAPWFEAPCDDKRLARLGVLSHLLGEIDYKGKDRKAIGEFGSKVVKNYAPKVKY
ncbi:MAG: polyphosphate kinase 2 [Helicobacteraceae bacterium]|jgi:polyphosphate kinase 2 (PPK2 family)|nr:polyphosphate kinase 2 [Helicobacteraceae bacterium]